MQAFVRKQDDPFMAITAVMYMHWRLLVEFPYSSPCSTTSLRLILYSPAWMDCCFQVA